MSTKNSGWFEPRFTINLLFADDREFAVKENEQFFSCILQINKQDQLQNSSFSSHVLCILRENSLNSHNLVRDYSNLQIRVVTLLLCMDVSFIQ